MLAVLNIKTPPFIFSPIPLSKVRSVDAQRCVQRIGIHEFLGGIYQNPEQHLTLGRDYLEIKLTVPTAFRRGDPADHTVRRRYRVPEYSSQSSRLQLSVLVFSTAQHLIMWTYSVAKWY